MVRLPWLSTWSSLRIPLGWTILSCIAVFAIGLPVYNANPSNRVGIAVLFGIWGFWITFMSLAFLFIAILDRERISAQSATADLLNLLDVWFALLVTQTAVLYVSYMFNGTSSFLGLDPTGGPFYAYLQLFAVIATNFHGAAAAGVYPEAAFPYIWISLCSIVAQIYFLFAVPIILWGLLVRYNKRREKRIKI